MKAKMHQPRSEQVREEVQQEIRNFLQALDSYPARVAKDPRVSFQQHLGSLFAAAGIHIDDDRRDDRIRRQ
jgi:hypothetical protein